MTTAKIRGIDHIGITVPDIDVETKFLVEALGAEIIYESNCLSFMHLCTGNLLVPVTKVAQRSDLIVASAMGAMIAAARCGGAAVGTGQ